jgi:hypothetical protein
LSLHSYFNGFVTFENLSGLLIKEGFVQILKLKAVKKINQSDGNSASDNNWNRLLSELSE